MPFPPTFTNSWDVTFPPDTQLANLLGQDLRNVRVDVMQRMSLLSGTFANRPTPETVNATWGGAGFGLIYISTDTNQIFQWNGAAWVDISTSVKAPVQAVNLTTQAANFPTQNLALTVSGFYRISAYLVITQAATTSSQTPSATVGWTDADSSVVESNVSFITGTGANIVGGVVTSPTFVMNAKTGTNVTLTSAGYSSTGATPMQYALHARLEGPF